MRFHLIWFRSTPVRPRLTMAGAIAADALKVRLLTSGILHSTYPHDTHASPISPQSCGTNRYAPKLEAAAIEIRS